MLILLSNDDGYLAPGLQALASALRSYADRVLIVAPDRNMSGASHSLTLSRPLSVQTHGNDVFSVDGTPSDCVHLALNGYFEHKADMVVSGINRGANLGDDVMYSGTVAAAYEGRNLGFPAVAVSNVSHRSQHFADSALLVVDLLKRLQKHILPQGTFLNVNIPDLPYAEIKGFKTTVLGRRLPAQPIQRVNSPRGDEYLWIGAFGMADDAQADTDFAAVAQGYVSVTPLQFDLTHRAQLAAIERCLALD